MASLVTYDGGLRRIDFALTPNGPRLSVRLGRVGAIEVEQTLPGRLFGYGTVTAGELEISYVSRPRELTRLLEP